MAQWALLVGPKGSGKSTSALNVVALLRKQDLRVEGFVQVGWTDDLERKGYDLMRLKNEERARLARPGSIEKPGEQAFCSFLFEQSAFEDALRWAAADAPGSDVLVVDEVSKLEASGKGHYDVIAWSLPRDDIRIVLLCVRADQLFYVMEKFGLEDEPVAMAEIPADEHALAQFAQELVRLAQGS